MADKNGTCQIVTAKSVELGSCSSTLSKEIAMLIDAGLDVIVSDIGFDSRALDSAAKSHVVLLLQHMGEMPSRTTYRSTAKRRLAGDPRLISNEVFEYCKPFVDSGYGAPRLRRILNDSSFKPPRSDSWAMSTTQAIISAIRSGRAPLQAISAAS